MDREDLAYIAGYFDADGCVSVNVDYRNLNVVTVNISVAGRNIELLRWLKNNLGGHLTKEERTTAWDTEVIFWRWEIHGAAAVPFLEQILPFLRYKQEQAEAALRIARSVGAYKYRVPDSAVIRRWKDALLISRLNQANMTEPKETKCIRVLEGLLAVQPDDMFE